MPVFGGTGVSPSAKGLTTQAVTLPAGGTWLIPASGVGNWNMDVGVYSGVQVLDPVTNLWRTVGSGYQPGGILSHFSDGVNYRIANQSGCAVGALLTNAGSGYTSVPTVTASAGGSIWRAIVGGAVSTSVTVTTGGTGYTYPPIVLFSYPPAGGIPATGTATISGGIVTGVTLTNQGAGYSTPPTIVFINDPRETNPVSGQTSVSVGYGASAVAILTGANTVTAVVCVDHGNPQTSVPTLAFSGGGGSGAAGTPIMNFAVTGYTVSTAGAGLAGSAAILTAQDAFPTTAAAYTNPAIQSGLVAIRPANIKCPITAGAITATGLVVYDGGCYTSVPNYIVNATASVVTTAPVPSLTVGGITDTSFIYSA